MPKVLLVDDSKTIQKVAGLILKGSAYSLLSAEDKDVAQKIAEEQRPDICLVDLTIGPTDGIDLIKIFRQNANLSKMKTALLYSHFKNLPQKTVEQAGADGKLAKPFDSKEFLALLEQLRTAKEEVKAKAQAPAAIPKPPIKFVSDPSDTFKSLFEDEELDQALEFLDKPLSEAFDKPKPVASKKSEPEISLQSAPREMIEKICWEVIPPLAERIIREEIQKLIDEKD